MPDAVNTPSKPALARCTACGAMNRVDLARVAQGPKCARCKAALALDRPRPVTDAEFAQVLAGTAVPVVVDFYADWCGPCHAMAPILDRFASTQAGEVLVLKLDTDANPATATRFGIRGIPTLIAFREGRELRRHVGVADLRALEALVA